MIDGGAPSVEEDLKEDSTLKNVVQRVCCLIEPDFLEQKEWLTEEIEMLGHKIIFYPKYHCELNFIENIWG